jgi:hypothetical protein
MTATEPTTFTAECGLESSTHERAAIHRAVASAAEPESS